SAAYQLARKGHAVTIFDGARELGGMMRYGIPGFRTPRACSMPRSAASSISASSRA
ncbi:MAG: NAD(P)-binding protein, partial [Rhodospirillales bacterium]|nr:NAD(P)-binding protein [Rhodospirillales bacterium]